MATVILQIKEFNSDEEWAQYIERVKHFFNANDIQDNGKKRSILLSAIGAKTYKLLRNLVAPATPGDKTFDEIVQVVKDYYDPKPSEIVQRFKFNSWNRKQTESVSAYMSELRALANKCNFGTTLDDMLRDRLVCGINDNQIQRKLLSEGKLTLKRAVELATGAEVASNHVKEIANATGGLEQSVNKVFQTSKPHEKGRERHRPRSYVNNSDRPNKCYGCGKSNHEPSECYFKDKQCHNCNKEGHIAAMCPSKSKREEQNSNSSVQSSTGRNRNKSGHRQNSVKLVANEEAVSIEPDSENTQDYPMFALYHHSPGNEKFGEDCSLTTALTVKKYVLKLTLEQHLQ